MMLERIWGILPMGGWGRDVLQEDWEPACDAAGQPQGAAAGWRSSCGLCWWAGVGVMAPTLLPPPRLLGMDCYAEEGGPSSKGNRVFRKVVSRRSPGKEGEWRLQDARQTLTWDWGTCG